MAEDRQDCKHVQTFLPFQLFKKIKDCNAGSDSCFILLNSKLYGMEEWLKSSWHLFSVKACADGGSNILFDCMGTEKHEYIPDLICGDLDSARQEVVKYYKEKGTEVVCESDQDCTDFLKTLNLLLLKRTRGKLKFSSVYVLNALWGRFDQTLGNIATLFKAPTGSIPVYLMSEDSITFLLKPGTSCIAVSSGLEEGHCGLVPLGEPCASCTSTGLTWNLDHQRMEINGLISTSNIIDPSASQVTVTCSHNLLWTMSHTLNK